MISKVKGRNKNKGYLTQKEILDQSWYGFEDSMSDHFKTLIQAVESKENMKASKNVDFNNFYNMVKDYYQVMSFQLSVGAVDVKSLESLLNKLVEKYGVK